MLVDLELPKSVPKCTKEKSTIRSVENIQNQKVKEAKLSIKCVPFCSVGEP